MRRPAPTIYQTVFHVNSISKSNQPTVCMFVQMRLKTTCEKYINYSASYDFVKAHSNNNLSGSNWVGGVGGSLAPHCHFSLHSITQQ